VRFLASGRAPRILAVPAVASGLIGEALVAELKQRAARAKAEEVADAAGL
jgi:hypothetical protein